MEQCAVCGERIVPVGETYCHTYPGSIGVKHKAVPGVMEQPKVCTYAEAREAAWQAQQKFGCTIHSTGTCSIHGFVTVAAEPVPQGGGRGLLWERTYDEAQLEKDLETLSANKYLDCDLGNALRRTLGCYRARLRRLETQK